jgi:hypothetical protein
VPIFTKTGVESNSSALASRMNTFNKRLMMWIVTIAVKKPGLLAQAAVSVLPLCLGKGMLLNLVAES